MSIKPTVSVHMITYNHSPYIRQAIEGVLMQQANFPVKLIIGEDGSTDDTRSICAEYAKKFPDKIRLLPMEGNKGMMKNFADTFIQCDGKYIALCEGDDYWTDPLKLQKQVDFLEQNSTFSFAAHKGLNYYESSKEFIDEPIFKELLSFRDFAVYRCMIHTMSVVLRNSESLNDLFKQTWILSLSGADLLLYLYLTKDGSNAFCFENNMGVYRIHESGSWQGLKPKIRIQKAEKDLKLYTMNLMLSPKQKVILDWQFKGIIIGKLHDKLKTKPVLIKRGIIFFVNRILFVSGPGNFSSIVGRKINNYLSLLTSIYLLCVSNI